MSTLLIPPPPPGETTVQPSTTRVPPLMNGDRLSGAEFMRRYEAMPDVKAELIHGIVYMSSPVRTTPHAAPLNKVSGWLAVYQSMHPHLIAGTDGTVILADGERLQPDAFLLNPDGNARLDEDDGYVYGAPELVCEIAASTANIDAHEKAESYAAAGVAEYLLWRTEERPRPRLDWFTLKDGLYHPLPADENDVIESRQFPGLRLNRRALLAGDMAAVLATLSKA